jgi:hypothetical protein
MRGGRCYLAVRIGSGYTKSRMIRIVYGMNDVVRNARVPGM